jgi:ADP-heptose:LPS heptosyltransferase
MIPRAGAIGRIGLLRNDALGDTLLVLPVATALKRHDPQIEVELICDSAVVDLMGTHPDLDAAVTDPGGGSADLARVLRARKYDAVIVLRPTPRNAWGVFRARIPVRVGTAFRWYGPLFNYRWYGHRKTNIRHEVEYNLDLLRVILGTDPGAPQYYLSPPPTEKESALKILQAAGINHDKPVVAVHPGSRGSALAWPIQNFVSLAELLSSKEVQIIVTGTPEETELTSQVAAIEGALDLTGRTTLGQLAWIYKECDSVVANSTGPLHLGSAVGTKVVGIYPAAEINSPIRWGPFGPGHMAFRGPVDNCPKCIWEECPLYNCLEMVPVAEVARVTMGVAAQSPHVGEWKRSDSAPEYSHRRSP